MPAAFWNLIDVAESVAGVTVKVPVVLIFVPIVLAALATPVNTKERTTKSETIYFLFMVLIINQGLGGVQ